MCLAGQPGEPTCSMGRKEAAKKRKGSDVDEEEEGEIKESSSGKSPRVPPKGSKLKPSPNPYASLRQSSSSSGASAAAESGGISVESDEADNDDDADADLTVGILKKAGAKSRAERGLRMDGVEGATEAPGKAKRPLGSKDRRKGGKALKRARREESPEEGELRSSKSSESPVATMEAEEKEEEEGGAGAEEASGEAPEEDAQGDSKTAKKKKKKKKKKSAGAELDAALALEKEALAHLPPAEEGVGRGKPYLSLEAPDEGAPPVTAEGGDGADTLAMRRLLRAARYFDEPEEAPRCFNCGQPGHVSRECTEEGRARPCYVCGRLGHEGRECPEGTHCFKCGAVGHVARDCQSRAGAPATRDAAALLCMICGHHGHGAATCWRDYDPEDLELVQCYICGEFGHLSCADVVTSAPFELTCYNCGEPGHTGEGCARPRGMYREGDDERAAAQVCYNCGETGHFARGCSKGRPHYQSRSVDYDQDTRFGRGHGFHQAAAQLQQSHWHGAERDGSRPKHLKFRDDDEYGDGDALLAGGGRGPYGWRDEQEGRHAGGHAGRDATPPSRRGLSRRGREEGPVANGDGRNDDEQARRKRKGDGRKESGRVGGAQSHKRWST